jgi:hypothetical protein
LKLPASSSGELQTGLGVFEDEIQLEEQRLQDSKTQKQG